MTYRGFKYRVYPTRKQEELFAQFAGVCRLVWNLALEQRRDHWRNYFERTGTHLNFVAQCRELTLLRKEFDFIRAVNASAQSRVLKSLDTAYRRAWSGKAEYPKKKRKGRNDTFSFAGRDVRIEKINRRWSRIRLPKIGWVKYRDTRPVVGKITEAIVTRTVLGWHVSIGCKVNLEVSDNGRRIGIDRGVSVPLMLSDGTGYAMPASVANLDRRARKAQRIASRRKRGSKRHSQAVRRTAQLKARQARVRENWAHKATTDICRRYSTVVVERLRTKNMTKSAKGTLAAPGRNVAQKRGLNRAILNVGWHQIETMLSYKAANLIKVNPAYSSQTCASCGTVDSRSRKSQASFVCTACGHRDNADRNAAAVILRRGNTPGVEPIRWDGDEARTIQVVNPLDVLGQQRPGGCECESVA